MSNRKPHSEETKAKIAAALKGRKGVSPSPATREKIRQANLRRPPATAATREKLSKASKGRVYSEEHRQRLRAAAREFTDPPEVRSSRARKTLLKRQDPRWMKCPEHLSAVCATFVSPENVTYEVRNISHFVRTHAHLFAPEDVVWGGKYNRMCRAAVGLRTCRLWLYATDENRLKKMGRTWKGCYAKIDTTSHTQNTGGSCE